MARSIRQVQVSFDGEAVKQVLQKIGKKHEVNIKVSGSDQEINLTLENVDTSKRKTKRVPSRVFSLQFRESTSLITCSPYSSTSYAVKVIEAPFLQIPDKGIAVMEAIKKAKLSSQDLVTCAKHVGTFKQSPRIVRA
jgi:hypothetical protein